MKKKKEKSTVTAQNVISVIRPIVFVILIGTIYLFFFQKFGWGIPCIFRLVTGRMCPGCGMTHAIAEIANGNFTMALQYNALSLTVLPVMCIYIIFRIINEKIIKHDGFYKWEYVLIISVFIIVVGYWIVRNRV